MKHNYFFKKHGLMIAIASFLSFNASAQSWTGTAADGNFTNPLNWAGLADGTVLTAANSLVFTGVATHNDANIFKGSNNDNRATVKTEAGSTLTVNKTLMIAGSDYLNGTINITNTDWDGVTNTATTDLNSRPGTGTLVGSGAVGVINVGSAGSTTPTNLNSNNILYIGTGLNGDGTVNVYRNASLTVNSVLRLSHTRNPANGTLNINGGTVTAKGMQLGENHALSTGTATINLYAGSISITGASELPRPSGPAHAIVNIYNGNLSTTTTLTINNASSKVEFKVNPNLSAPTGVITTGTSTKLELQALIDAGKIVKPAGYDWVWGTTGGVNLSVVPSTTPIRLVSFTAAKATNGVSLSWITSSEKDNAEFILSHSTDGKTFSRLTAVAGKNAASTYNFTHLSPVSGNNYYQLTQVDLNGTETVVGVRSANFSISGGLSVNVFPNPASDLLNVTVAGKENSVKDVTLLDLNGRVLLRETSSAAMVQLNLKGKSLNGTYIINVKAGELNESKKIVIQ